MLTVLACVRTPDAARAIAVCADRLGVSASVRTAVTAVEAIARLAERSADLVFVDGPLTRPDPVGFVRRVMAYAPRATLVVYGLPEPSVASALISAGARGVIRGGDTDLVTAVTKTVLLLGLTDSIGIGAVATPSASVTRSPEVARSQRVEAGSAGTRTVVVAKSNLTGQVAATERTSSPLDTRNGGPGYTLSKSVGPESDRHVEGIHVEGIDAPPRGVGTLGVSPVHSGVRGSGGLDVEYGADLRGGGVPGAPTFVPQQRIDLPHAGGVRPPALTERELQVLRGMADGKSNAEIGRELFVSEDTVKTHARRLFRKLGARDRAHAVASGFRSGLVG